MDRTVMLKFPLAELSIDDMNWIKEVYCYILG